MAEYKKTDGVIYRCPLCLFTLNDVPISEDENGIFRCVKCGYNGDFENMTSHYYNFRSRYALMGKRITLDEQKGM